MFKSNISTAVPVLFGILAVLTLLPNKAASKVNLFGYQSICTFAPASTIILVVLAAAGLFFSVKKLSSKKK